MKVVFLDIDGVLNHEDWYVKRHSIVDAHSIKSQYPFYEFDPESVAHLNSIVERTGCKVVVSSTWRLGRSIEELSSILEKCGFKGEIIDKTPHFHADKFSVPRGCEIEWWLKQKGFQRINWSREEQEKTLASSQVKNYVILDDDSDMLLSQQEHFVKTSWKSGLSQEKADIAVKILLSTVEELYYE